MFERVCRSRPKRRNARSEAEILCKELGEHHCAAYEFFMVKSWHKACEKVSVFPTLSGVLGRDNNVNKIKITSEKRAIEMDAVYNNFSTSGSYLVLWSPGEPNFACSCEDHTRERCLFYLFL